MASAENCGRNYRNGAHVLPVQVILRVYWEYLRVFSTMSAHSTAGRNRAGTLKQGSNDRYRTPKCCEYSRHEQYRTLEYFQHSQHEPTPENTIVYSQLLGAPLKHYIHQTNHNLHIDLPIGDVVQDL